MTMLFACTRVLQRPMGRRPATSCQAPAPVQGWRGAVRDLLAAGAVLVLMALVASVPGTVAAQDAPGGPDVTAPSSSRGRLLPLAAALHMDGQVQVAGTIDHATVHQQQVDGSPGHRLELVDATGSRLRVAVPGALPDGLEAAEVAVVSGSMADGRLLASRILLPREPVPVQEVQVRTEDPATGLTGVMVISLIVWVGLFIYVFRVDRRVHRMEVS